MMHEECEAALHIARGFKGMPGVPRGASISCTKNDPSQSQSIWRLTSDGMVGMRSASAHHWAQAGVMLGLFDDHREGEAANYRYGVLCQVFPGGVIGYEEQPGFGRTVLTGKITISGQPTGISVTAGDAVDRVIMMARQRFGIDTYTAQDYNRMVRGEVTRTALTHAANQGVVVQRPDYEELEQALDRLEKLTS